MKDNPCEHCHHYHVLPTGVDFRDGIRVKHCNIGEVPEDCRNRKLPMLIEYPRGCFYHVPTLLGN